jgi:AcrR family transcriptional regulator
VKVTAVSDPAPRERNLDSLFFRHLHLAEGWESDRAAAVGTQRERMLEATVRAVAAKGYAKVTVADIVALAGVSRRTFYEHFSDKEDCFLETYETASRTLVAGVAATVGHSGLTDWHDRVRLGIEAYTRMLAAEPDLAYALLVEVLGAGPRAIELRREVFRHFVELYRPSPGGTTAADVAMGAVPDTLPQALVGGISELVQEHILTRGAETLPELAPTLVELAFSIVELGGRLGDP